MSTFEESPSRINRNHMSPFSEQFIPNNHSQWEIGYRPVSTEVQQEVLEIMQTHFTEYIDAIEKVEQVDEAEINSNNFKLTGKKGIEDRPFLLRRILSQGNRERTHATSTLMEELFSRDISLPRIRTSPSGEYIEADKYLYTLYDFIDGNHYRGTFEELVSAGEKIGKLDTALLALTPEWKDEPSFNFTETYSAERTFSKEIWDDIFKKAEGYRSGEVAGGVADRLLSRAEEIYRFIETATLPEGELVRQLVHFDLHPHNLLANGSDIIAVLDFDSIRYIEKMRAFSFAYHRLVRQHIIYTQPDDREGAFKKATKAFLESYRTTGDLSDNELEMVPAFIQNESMARLTSAIKEYAETGVLVWKTDLEKQLANCHEAKLFNIHMT